MPKRLRSPMTVSLQRGRWLPCCALSLVTLLVPQFLQAQDIAQVKKGVVKITAQAEGQQPKVGTGFIVRVEKNAAYIVTASHVVEGDPKPQVTFYPQPQQTFAGRIIGVESENRKGLASLLVAGPIPEGVAALALDQTSLITGGEPVTFVGFPRTLAPWAVSTGSLTALKGPELVFQAPGRRGAFGWSGAAQRQSRGGRDRRPRPDGVCGSVVDPGGGLERLADQS